MSEKHYTVKDLKSHNDYRFTISYNSFTVEFILQSSYAKDRYESGPINLSGFHQKNKVFNQFDSTLKIADVIGSKIEKKQYSLEVPVFILKYDFQENIRFDLKPSKGASTSVAANPDVTKQRIANLDKIAKEQIKAAQRNSYTGSKNQIQFSQPQPQSQGNLFNLHNLQSQCNHINLQLSLNLQNQLLPINSRRQSIPHIRHHPNLQLRMWYLILVQLLHFQL